MIYIGNDIVENNRITRLINLYGTKFLHKIFSSKEIESIKRKDISTSCSGKFAAKEASAKALLSSGIVSRVSLKDIVVLSRDDGAPFVEINIAQLDKIKDFKISISHTDQYATAVALLELFE